MKIKNSLTLIFLILNLCLISNNIFGQLSQATSKVYNMFFNNEDISPEPFFLPTDMSKLGNNRLMQKIDSTLNKIDNITTELKRNMEVDTLTKWIFGSKDLNVGQNTSLSFTGNNTLLSTELVSDYIAIDQIIMKVGLVALVDNSKDSTNINTDRFFETGGNAVLYLALPLIHFNEIEQFGLFKGDCLIVPKFGGDLPALNKSITNPTYNSDFGIEGYSSKSSFSSKLLFFFQTRFGLVVGSRNFYDNLGLGKHHPFGYWKLAGGIELNQLIRIGASGFVTAPDKLQNSSPLIFTVSLVQNL